MMNEATKAEARKIVNIYRFYNKDGKLYLNIDDDMLDDLFENVTQAINECGVLKPTLPYDIFVHPSKQYWADDQSWVGHFEDRDNRRFFLSDIHDYLILFQGLRGEVFK